MNNHQRRLTAQAKIFKALGHPSRLIMAEALFSGEKCVCELQEIVGADLSTISRHLTVLREAGIVAAEKRGTNIYYSLAICCLEQFLTCTSNMISTQLQAKTSLFAAK